MMNLVAQTRVVCAALDKKRTGVRLARCRAGGFDIGANMVHTGWVLAFRPESIA
jgi:endonuclease YncB( thermonuclease family)